MQCQNSNFGNPHGCLVGKNKPFAKQFATQLEKNPLNPSAQDLKIHWVIHFLTMLNIGRNAPKKNLNSNYIVLYEKRFSDSILDLGKCPNPKTHESESACFQVGHFARSKIESESIFLIKFYIITILNIFWSNLVYIYQSRKMDFPLYFQILSGRVQGFFSSTRSYFLLPNGLFLPTKQPWGSPKIGFCHHHLQLSPS